MATEKIQLIVYLVLHVIVCKCVFIIFYLALLVCVCVCLLLTVLAVVVYLPPSYQGYSLYEVILIYSYLIYTVYCSFIVFWFISEDSPNKYIFSLFLYWLMFSLSLISTDNLLYSLGRLKGSFYTAMDCSWLKEPMSVVGMSYCNTSFKFKGNLIFTQVLGLTKL